VRRVSLGGNKGGNKRVPITKKRKARPQQNEVPEQQLRELSISEWDVRKGIKVLEQEV